jgi:hypothetical protein
MNVINLFGSPGAAKSTIAGGLFWLMKCERLDVELVTEYAKYLVWAERIKMFEEQVYVFAKQNHKLEILKNKVEYAITDCPLLLSHVYAPDSMTPAFKEMVLDIFNGHNNINIFVNRTVDYDPLGRYQTESEADIISKRIYELLKQYDVPFIELDSARGAPFEIYERVTGKMLNVEDYSTEVLFGHRAKMQDDGSFTN